MSNGREDLFTENNLRNWIQLSWFNSMVNNGLKVKRVQLIESFSLSHIFANTSTLMFISNFYDSNRNQSQSFAMWLNFLVVIGMIEQKIINLRCFMIICNIDLVTIMFPINFGINALWKKFLFTLFNVNEFFRNVSFYSESIDNHTDNCLLKSNTQIFVCNKWLCLKFFCCSLKCVKISPLVKWRFFFVWKTRDVEMLYTQLNTFYYSFFKNSKKATKWHVNWIYVHIWS